MKSADGAETPWPLNLLMDAAELAETLAMPLKTVRAYAVRPSTWSWFPRPIGTFRG